MDMHVHGFFLFIEVSDGKGFGALAIFDSGFAGIDFFHGQEAPFDIIRRKYNLLWMHTNLQGDAVWRMAVKVMILITWDLIRFIRAGHLNPLPIYHGK